jgi:hypothetical protein
VVGGAEMGAGEIHEKRVEINIRVINTWSNKLGRGEGVRR